MCNEIYKDVPFADACGQMKRLGYEGIEIAPFTLAETPSEVSAAKRAGYRRTIADAGLTFVGLHWLMVSPAGLHVTTTDAALRRRSWRHVAELIDLCADLGPDGLLVFGSPKQRNALEGVSPSDATAIFAEELSRLAPHAEQSGVKILIEALPRDQSNIVNTLEAAVRMVDRIGSPAIRTMFDTHNAADETAAHTELVKRYIAYIEHVHVNEMNGEECGRGDYDFKSLLKTLAELDYRGWVSLEVFDFSRTPEEIAGTAIRHLKKQASQ